MDFPRLPARAFRRYRWRDSGGKKLSARFAFFAVRVPQGSDDSRQWLILERRDGAVREVRAHLSSLPDCIGRRRLVYLLKEHFFPPEQSPGRGAPGRPQADRDPERG